MRVRVKWGCEVNQQSVDLEPWPAAANTLNARSPHNPKLRQLLR